MSSLLRDDRGETLIELMITILIISIGMVTLVGAVGSAIIASDVHRGLAEGDVIVRDFGEAIKQRAAENQDDPLTLDNPLTSTRENYEYTECPGETELAPGAFFTPAGWLAPTIDDIEWWTPAGGWSSSNAACLAHYDSCGEDNEACDAGLQRITYSVARERTGAQASVLTATVVVRKPNPVVTP